MAKTISIKKSVYEELKAFKKENESFSEFLNRLVKSQSRKNILESLRGSTEFENKEKLIKEIENKRWKRRN